MYLDKISRHEPRRPIRVFGAVGLLLIIGLAIATLVVGVFSPRHLTATLPPELQLKADVRSLGGSGVAGTATAADAGANAVAIRIVVSWKGYPEMAAAIASGSCDAVGPIRFTLASVKRGASQSEVPGNLNSIQGLLVVTYRSTSTTGPLTSCGRLD